MRIQAFGSAIALGVAALGTLGLRRISQHDSVALSGDAGAAGPDLLRRAWRRAWPTNGGLEFQRYAAIVAQQLQARGYTPATSTPEREHDRSVRLRRRPRPGPLSRRDPFYGSLRSMAGFYGPGWRLLSSALRLGFRRRFFYRLGRSVLVWRRHRQLCRISQPDRPPHSPDGHECAAVRRPRPGALGDQPARRRSCRAWSKRCSPASRATAARRSRSPSRRRPTASGANDFREVRRRPAGADPAGLSFAASR